MNKGKKNANVLEYIRRREYRRRLQENEVWGHVGGRAYTLLKWIYIIDFIYILIFALGFILASFLRIDDILSSGLEYNLEELIWHKNRTYFIIMLTVVALITLVFLLLKKHLAFLISNSIISVFFAVGFQTKENIGKYITANLIPLVLLLGIGIIIYIIYFKDKQWENREYNKLISHLYTQATKDKQSYTEEQWQEYLDSLELDYKTEYLSNKPPKRSQRSRMRKQDAEYNAKGDINEE